MELLGFLVFGGLATDWTELFADQPIRSISWVLAS